MERNNLKNGLLGMRLFFRKKIKKNVIHANLQSYLQSPFTLTYPYYQEALSYDDATKMQYIDLNTWLPGNILMKADKMTMANSLELRVPFLDREVFDVASTLS